MDAPLPKTETPSSTGSQKKTPFYKNWVFWFCVCLALAVLGQNDGSSDGSEVQEAKEQRAEKKRRAISEFSVVGMYSGPGLYGWPCTVELLLGGSFIQKDPGLPGRSTYYGEWTIENERVCFYGNGQKMFTATVDEGNLHVNGRVWKKVR